MLVSTEVEICLSGNIKYYEDLGYEIPKHLNKRGKLKYSKGEKITVKVKDLFPTSNVKIEYRCDGICNKIRTVSYSTYMKSLRDDGRSYCINCKHLPDFYSFGQWMIDNNLNPYDYWSEENNLDCFKVHYRKNLPFLFKCPNKNYHPSYFCKVRDFTLREYRCPFCSNKRLCKEESLGYKSPKSLFVWSFKNSVDPYEVFSRSNKSFFWKCENDKHDDYERNVDKSVKCDFRCPKCVKIRNESILQEKVRIYLESFPYTILHEQNCTLHPRNPKTGWILRYDNEILELKLIIEVMGEQHTEKSMGYYKIMGLSKDQSEIEFQESKLRDNFKKQYVLDSNYYFLEISFRNDDKKETWKKLIEDKIKEIKGEI